jgi:hypothetical protein
MRVGFTPVLANTAEPHTHATSIPVLNTPVARKETAL